MTLAETASHPLPSALTPRIGFVLAVASQSVIERVEAALAPHGINSRQYGILAQLQAVGSQRQRELCQALRIDRTSMVGFLDGLQELGLTERRPHPHDRRAHAVHLTPRGHDLLTRATELVQHAEAAFLRPLSPAEEGQLRTLLGKLLEVSA